MARRVNTRFLIILTAVIVALGGAGLVVRKLTSRPNAQRHVQAAERLIKDGNFEAATAEYANAVRVDPTNKDLHVKLGDVANQRTAEMGWQALDIARRSWMSALEIDPQYKPALGRLMDSYTEQLQQAPLSMQPAQFGALKDIASRLTEADPGNLRAQGVAQTVAIEQWLQGGAMPQKALDDTFKALAQVQAKDPANPDLLFTLTRGLRRVAYEARVNGNNQRAKEAMDQANALLEAATKVQPPNASLLYRASDAYRLFASVQTTREDAQKNIDQANAVLDRARAAATKDNPQYVDIQVAAANAALQRQDRAGAEQILRTVVDDPATRQNQYARLELGRVLRMSGDPAKREQAIKLLSEPVADTHEPGVRGILFKSLQTSTTEELIYVRIDQYASSPDTQQRNQLLVQIDDGYKKVASQARSETAALLRLRATVELVKGQKAQALETLKHAVDLMDHMPVKPNFQYDLIYQLARAYFDAGQNRAAEVRLQQVLQAAPAFVPARTLLIALYLQERNAQGAEDQINTLTSQQPNSPDVLRFRVALAQVRGNSQDAKTLFQQLPEDTIAARQFKGERAIALEDYPEAARLLDGVLKENPKDFRAIALLAGVYLKQDHRDQAKELVSRSMAQLPDEPRLKILQKQVEGASREEVNKFAQELFASNDPVLRELEAARMDAAQAKYDSALQHLDAVRKQRADNVDAWKLAFQIYLAQKRFDLAADAVANLSRLDADQGNGRAYAWQLAMTKKDYPEAIRIAREMTTARSAFGQSWRMLGDALRASGQFNDALTQYRVALDIQSLDVDSYIGGAACLDAMDQPDQARELAESGRQRTNDRRLKEIVLDHDLVKHAADVVPERQKMLDAAPNDAASYFNVANASMMAAEQVREGDSAKADEFKTLARQTLDKGVAKFPKDLRLNASLAEMMEKSGQFDAGAKVISDLAALPEYKDRFEMSMLLGEYYARGSHPEEAEKFFRQALEQSHGDVSAQIRLAQHLTQEQRYDAALEVLSGKANADNLQITRAQVRTLAAAGRFDQAQKLLTSTIEQHPNSEDLMMMLSGVELSAHRYAAAREQARKVLALDPKNDQALYFQGLTELEDPVGGDMSVAIRALSDLVTRHSREIQYKLDLSRAYARRQDRDAAAQQLEEALRLDPLNNEVRGRLLQAYLDDQKWSRFEQVVRQAETDSRLNSNPSWPHAHALALVQQKDFAGALAKINEAIKLDKANTPLFRRDNLDILIQAKDYKGALTRSDEIIKEGYREPWVYASRGVAKAALGDKSAAIAEFDQAIAVADNSKNFADAADAIRKMASSVGVDDALARVNPRMNSENRWRLLAVELCVGNGKLADAITMLQPLLADRAKLSPVEQLDVARYAAEAYHFSGQHEKAREEYLEWLKLSPGNQSVLNNLAYLLAVDMHKPDEAKAFSQQAYDAANRDGIVNPGIADTHGWVLTLCGGREAQSGLNILTSIVQDNPSFIEARYHLGMAYLRMNDAKTAEQQLATAMDQLNKLEEQHRQVSATLKSDVTEGLKKAREQAGAKVGA